MEYQHKALHLSALEVKAERRIRAGESPRKVIASVFQNNRERKGGEIFFFFFALYPLCFLTFLGIQRKLVYENDQAGDADQDPNKREINDGDYE